MKVANCNLSIEFTHTTYKRKGGCCDVTKFAVDKCAFGEWDHSIARQVVRRENSARPLLTWLTWGTSDSAGLFYLCRVIFCPWQSVSCKSSNTHSHSQFEHPTLLVERSASSIHCISCHCRVSYHRQVKGEREATMARTHIGSRKHVTQTQRQPK